MAEVVRVRGLGELQRSLQKVNREVAKTVRRELMEVAEPVAATARAKEGRWTGASIGTIGPRASTRGVFVTQRKRKVTGKRPDFGDLQMRHALIPALDENENLVVRGLDNALDRLTRSAGL